MFTELTEDKLEQLLNSNTKVMVQYGASWCGNCKITKPKFKRMAEENPDIEFYYVDAEKLPNSRQFADVSNLPTFAGFVDGKLVKQAQGNKVEIIQEVRDAVAGN
ncbi:thioredoxin family protein [Crocinitomicaceae bacterium CZZ-1]|uniref:Thioredoxin family protein n=1 Tax=Taishania pollutisoli TaxID=2766479 RepID=A0A8J6PDR6_9FLAO|nr:thioredoxin family protein [Taishania pollutisoli]MBC9811645.1 thioredoxin family protein [Taishania pollutisoli]MBX2948420.1 thioredoxin family protein [Crocinitomicaceae bacterium]NGF75518.1 thioredoxin family protein [Fluviicola sp. SGL-29]